jgi:hypothetical protein
MTRIALVFVLMAPIAAQDRPVVVQATVIQCKAGDRKALPAGKLDAIAKQLADETAFTHFDVLGSGSVRTEDGTFTKLSLGTPMNLLVTFKPSITGSTTLSDLQLMDETEKEVVTTTATATVKEKKAISRVLLSTKCTVTGEEPMLVAVVGTADGALALVLRVSAK